MVPPMPVVRVIPGNLEFVVSRSRTSDIYVCQDMVTLPRPKLTPAAEAVTDPST
ncbi:MAG: hypothetical protein KDA60_17135 [Planctomycetales bacterium]|nr:hypothetical protein [Planctomycetales bacterium]